MHAPHKILVMGLPGAGKTTFATLLAARMRAVHFNADQVRKQINKELGFSLEDRIEQARRMGWLCDQVVAAGYDVIADLVCPTPQTREAFAPSIVIWVDRIAAGRYEDTNKMFVPPEPCDFRIPPEGSAERWSETLHKHIDALRR